MGGNRKHGFRRGNANGRNGYPAAPWFCAGCRKHHAGRTGGTVGLDGVKLCERQYIKCLEAELSAKRVAALSAWAGAHD